MQKFYLVRHGETDWNVQGRMQGLSDTSLNANGLQQAQCLAERLAEEQQLKAIYSSPLQRAFKTAEVIGERLGLPVIADARLVEHHIGQLEGLTLSEIKDQFPEVYRTWNQGGTRQPFPGEEPRESFQGRIRDFIEDVQSRHPNDSIVVVTHGGAMGMFLATLLELDITRRFPFWIDNASLSIVEMSGPVPRLRLLNDTCHWRNGHHPDEAAKFALDEKTTSAEVAAMEAR